MYVNVCVCLGTLLLPGASEPLELWVLGIKP